MILSLVLKLFSPKRSTKSNSVSSELAEKNLEQEQSAATKRELIVKKLITMYDEFRAKHVDAVSDQEDATWTTMNKHKVAICASGSYLMLDGDGRIIKTGDVLRRLKEFRYEDGTGEIMVKKFGVWNKINGYLSETGTLISKTNDGETHECLDGTLVYVSVQSQSLIAQNEQTGEEVALNLRGTLRHRYKKLGVDQFRLYRDGVLVTESESFEEPQIVMVKTLAEELRLESVNRIERNYENDKILSDSYTFFELRTGNQAVRLCLNLPTGELHLSKVQKIENIYVDGVLSETMFELSEPVSVSRDKEGHVSLIRGISKVRRFQMHGNVCAVVFIDNNGDENLYFPEM